MLLHATASGTVQPQRLKAASILTRRWFALFRNCILRPAGPDEHLEFPEVVPVIVQEHLNLLMDSAESFEVFLKLLEMFGMMQTSDIYDHGIPLKPGERLIEALHIFYVENNCTSFDPLDKP